MPESRTSSFTLPAQSRASQLPTLDPARVEAHRRWREELNRELYRHIAAWAKLYENCPRAGCRRNGVCMRPDGCHAHSDRPMSEEERLWMGKLVREALNAHMESRAKSATDK